MISLKYIEVLSKSLPAFCQNMKVEQQDKLVDLIYRCPNKFLFSVLIEIGEDFEGYCNELHHEITALRKEKMLMKLVLIVLGRRWSRCHRFLLLCYTN